MGLEEFSESDVPEFLRDSETSQPRDYAPHEYVPVFPARGRPINPQALQACDAVEKRHLRWMASGSVASIVAGAFFYQAGTTRENIPFDPPLIVPAYHISADASSFGQLVINPAYVFTLRSRDYISASPSYLSSSLVRGLCATGGAVLGIGLSVGGAVYLRRRKQLSIVIDDLARDGAKQ